MSRYQGTPDYSHNTAATTGVLITNLGTPDAPTPKALRNYLREFLWDPRVVEIPRPIWWLILHGIILRTRPGKVAQTYASVWTDEGSPLLAISRQQHRALEETFQAEGLGHLKFALGMRYGNPSIPSALKELREAGVQRLLVLPLYPQYSGSTTASTFDAVTRELQSWRWVPELRFITHYHDDPDYIQALASSIREYQQTHGSPEKLLMSFHGVPKRYLVQGDPYHCECHKTARLLAEELQLTEDQWQISFQSRFGKAEWLKPYTDKTLKEWGKQGIKNVQVICPGFSADCLETLEEIKVENRDYFLAAGGEQLQYIPALNDSPDHIAALANLIKRHLQGWPEKADDDTTARQQRAMALGAKG